DLLAGQGLESQAERPPPHRLAVRPAAQLPEGPVLEREVRDRVEDGRAREQMRMPGRQQQGLLPAHASAERVDLRALDSDPRQGAGEDLRHPGQVLDLACGPPRVPRQAAALTVRTDDGERSLAGEVA